ncbi:MAG: hypothetical protein PVI40_05175 [Chlamydiota bacterium]|jgi:hypothetical protein
MKRIRPESPENARRILEEIEGIVNRASDEFLISEVIPVIKEKYTELEALTTT